MWCIPRLESLVLLASVLPTITEFPPREREPIQRERAEDNEETKLAEVKGRFLLPNGMPASGVAVCFYGWQGNSHRVASYGIPDCWENVTTKTDEHGRFSIAIDPPRAFQFALDVKLAGHAGAYWRWHRIEPGQVVDVGDVHFSRGGTIVGHLVDSKGTPVSGRWRIYAESVSSSRRESRDTTRVHSQADLDTGQFRLEDVPPGRTKLSAFSSIACKVNGPTLEVLAGETVETRLVYSGPDTSSRIVVHPSTRPFYFRLDEGSIHLIGPDGMRRTSSKMPNSNGFAFDDLEPGNYVVEIDDPRYFPWSQVDVQIGTQVVARLKGNAGIRLALTTSEGVCFERYRMAIRYLSSNSSQNVFPILDRGKAPPKDGHFERLIPGTMVLEIEVPGYAPVDVLVDNLKANETRRIDARLGGWVDLTGTVYEADGSTPAGGITVSLKKRAMDHRRPVREALAQVTTDKGGRFAFERTAPGLRSLTASANAFVETTRDIVVGDESMEVSVSLPESTTLSGRLLAPEGVPLEELKITLIPRNKLDQWIFLGDIALAVDADGSFVAGHLPLGSVLLFLSPLQHRAGLGGRIEIANLKLSVDSTAPREIDSRAMWPGSLNVTVRKNGRPAPDMWVTAYGPGRAQASATTNAAGTTNFGFLRHGEWTFSVQLSDRSWKRFFPEKVTVGSMQTGEHQIDLEIAHATIRVVNATTGEPVKNQRIRIRPSGRSRVPIHWTDAEGRISLDLPVDTYTIEDGEGSNVQASKVDVVDWTANGPSKAEVRISLKGE